MKRLEEIEQKANKRTRERTRGITRESGGGEREQGRLGAEIPVKCRREKVKCDTTVRLLRLPVLLPIAKERSGITA